MTDEELKELVASNARTIQVNTQDIAELRASIAEMREYQQTEAREWREQRAADRDEWNRRFDRQNAEWKAAMQKSYDDMVQMLTQFAEEAAADRQTIRDMITAMFRHQSNGGGQSQQPQ